MLLTTPLIRAARQRWPDAQIDVLGHAGSLRMLAGNTDVSGLIEVEPGAGWLRSWKLMRRLCRRYDLAVITQRSDREYLYAWLAARVRTGPAAPAKKLAHAWKRWLLHHGVPDSLEQVHIVTEKLSLLTPWLETPQAIEVVAPPSIALPEAIAAQLRERYVVVHVPSMWRYKQWPLEHYRHVVAGLLADRWQVVLTGGPGDQDRQMVHALQDLGTPPALINAAGRLSFNQLSGLLGQAALYIGPDTSVTHLAAACGVRVISMFGPTNPLVWGPWPQGRPGASPYVVRQLHQNAGRIDLLQGPNGCVPCTFEGCERHRNSRSDCLSGLLPDRVLELALLRLREERGGGAP